MCLSPSVTEQNLGAEPGAVLRLLALSHPWVPAGSHGPSDKRGCACELSLPPAEPGRMEEEDGVLLVLITTFIFMEE